MTDETKPRCRATKHGGIDLTCELEQDHDRGESPTWHEATYTEHREATYQGARHVMNVTEHVTWEPVDQVKEAMRLMMKDKPRD
jgi:hypothetical protein